MYTASEEIEKATKVSHWLVESEICDQQLQTIISTWRYPNYYCHDPGWTVTDDKMVCPSKCPVVTAPNVGKERQHLPALASVHDALFVYPYSVERRNSCSGGGTVYRSSKICSLFLQSTSPQRRQFSVCHAVCKGSKSKGLASRILNYAPVERLPAAWRSKKKKAPFLSDR